MEQSGLTLSALPTLGTADTADLTIPSHYLALRLLGADLSRVVSPMPKRGWAEADKTMAVALAYNNHVPLVYIGSTDQAYRQVSSYLYERHEDFTIQQGVKRLWTQNLHILGSLDSRKIKECVIMTKELANKSATKLDRRYFSITPELFWDTDTAAFTASPELPVFVKLFDTPSPTQHTPRVDPLTPTQVDILKCSYESSLDYLHNHNGDLPEEYEFVTLWADYSHDVYMDIMKLMASPFMRRKPFGAFMLVGLRRNGKTALSGDFMKTLLGTANCTSVQLAQLGDPHFSAELQWTLWNAPDEEEERPTPYATMFKGLALDTPIPTPDGFSTMGELREGDVVYDRNFKPTKILHKSEVHYNPCYRIEFTTGESVIADHEHRWVARVGNRGNYSAEQVYTTEELASLILDKTIKIANPQDKGDASLEQLPVDPYVLGCWLGDGDKNRGSITNPSPALWQEIRRRGYEVSENKERRAGKCERRTVYGLFSGLRQLGLLGHKSLPSQYLRASRQVRLDVLRGLMDTDGFFGKNKPNWGGRAKMSTTQEWQRDAISQLVSSLGWTPTCTVVYRTGFGKRVKVYDIAFTPTENVFLVRNQDVQYASSARGARCRYIKSITPVTTVPTQCIEVSSPTHTYLFGEGHIVTHNTVADHGDVKTTRMYSQTPISISCDFMCAFPMNHHPVWTGSGAAACMSRSLIIEFTHQFEEDSNPIKFAERTFTSALYCRILGPIFALATYYRDRPMTFSQTMARQQKLLEGEMDSHVLYYERFIVFFDGFQSVNQLYNDYQLWCGAHDYSVSSKAAFKLAFGAFISKGLKSIKVNGKVVKGYRVRQQGKKPLARDTRYEVAGKLLPTLEDLHNSHPPLSIVERCESALEEKFDDDFERQLAKMISTARQNMRERSQDTPEEMEQSTLDLGSDSQGSSSNLSNQFPDDKLFTDT